MIAVIAADDGIAKAQLIGVVEARCKRGIDALPCKELFKAAHEHLLLCDLAALHLLPILPVDRGIARKRLLRAFAEAKFNVKALDGSALGGVKIQKRAIHVPQNRCDHFSFLQ